jgi:tetratricopeptide (TPR) repeat protein
MKASRFRSVSLSLLLLCASGISVLLVLPQETEARSKFEKASVDPAEDNFKQGMALIRANNWEAAIDSFQQAIYFSRNRYNPKAHHMLGLCFKATRQYGKAVQALLEHLKQTTEPAPDARIDLAECYIEIGEFDKARAEIQDSFRESPYNQSNHRQRYAQGELSERLGENAQALAFYRNAIEEKPLYTDAWLAKARVEVKIGEYKEAIKDYRTILEKSMIMRGINLE